MQDYWISFVNSLDPNDGLGNKRMQPFNAFGVPTVDNTFSHLQVSNGHSILPATKYVYPLPVSMQLNGHNTTMIPDDFRAEQIAFLNADPLVFNI
ncbi:hypothetical protein BD779DRAFT_1516658 [Infundibulicybe gibba]|nr:hypothetical protein BD779DRAFT_1516658 [Infundibulicybe gibba]